VRYRIGARALSIWSAWRTALVCVASCAAPAGPQTKVVNGQGLLPWINGAYEKPVIVDFLSDPNGVVARGSAMVADTTEEGSGVARTQLWRLMSGERGLNTDTIEQLADYLGLRISIERKSKTTKGR
jgi:hypothetical protein